MFGLRSKLLLRDFIGFMMNYDVMCMCKTRCDDGDTNNIRKVMVNSGFDIVCIRTEVHLVSINQEVDQLLNVK